MDQHEFYDLSETTYGLVIVLKDLIWKLEGIDKDNQRKFTGRLALIDTIEQYSYNIKVSIEYL